MDVIKKWVGWLLVIATALFFIAMWQSGGFDGLLDKIKLPSVSVDTK